MAKEIYEFVWYNEDDYGIMDHVSVIVQANDEAWGRQLAEEKIAVWLDLDDKELENFFKKYAKQSVDIITNVDVLAVSMNQM